MFHVAVVEKMIFFKKIVCVLWGLFFCAQSFAVLVYAHRGGRGLMPENTLYAFQYALKMGVDFIDLDIGMTRDGVLVVTHDAVLNPDITRDKNENWIQQKISVKQLTLHELQTYNVCGIKPETEYAQVFREQVKNLNCSIPSLAEVIDLVKSQDKNFTGIQIEIKTDPTQPDLTYSPQKLAEALVKLIHQKNIAQRIEVQSFDFRCLQAIQRLDAEIKTAYLTEQSRNQQMQNSDVTIATMWTAGARLKNYASIPHMIAALGGKIWGPQDSTVTPQEIAIAHRLGLKVVVWNSLKYSHNEFDANLMRKMLEWQVDGIITDRPDKLRMLIGR